MTAKGKLVLIIGPSGVGKSVIVRELRKRHPEAIFPRSATTRPRRPKEGSELYHFITDAAFDHWLAEEKFLEWARVHKGARYGTLLSEIIPAIEQRKIVIREVDVQGFESIRKHPSFAGKSAPHRLQAIFVLPESVEQLAERIRRRSPVTDDELNRRIESMMKELAYAAFTDAQIRNNEGKLAETIRDVESVIFR